MTILTNMNPSMRMNSTSPLKKQQNPSFGAVIDVSELGSDFKEYDITHNHAGDLEYIIRSNPTHKKSFELFRVAKDLSEKKVRCLGKIDALEKAKEMNSQLNPS